MSSRAINIKNFASETPGELSADKLSWQFPEIVGVNRNGRGTTWRIVATLEARRTPPADAPDSHYIPAEILDEYFDAKSCPRITIGGLPARAVLTVSASVVGGKVRDVVPTYVTAGKNLGKANATNVWTQALRDAISLHNKHAAAAQETVVADVSLIPPMLATDMENLTQQPVISAESPVWVQRKFNGVRAVAVMLAGADGVKTPTLYSRTKKIYPGYEYLSAELAPMFASVVADPSAEGSGTISPAITPAKSKPAKKGLASSAPMIIFDGELYTHGAILQDISGTSRRKDRAPQDRLHYQIYDCAVTGPMRFGDLMIDSESKWSARKAFLEAVWAATDADCRAARTRFDEAEAVIPAASRVDRYSHPVETFLESSLGGVNARYEQFRGEGYEGAMVRLDAPYIPSANGYHSSVLLKMKPLFDAEYEIVGWTTGRRGKAAAAIMIICKTAEGKEFPVTPAMEIPQRIALAARMELNDGGQTHFEKQWKGQPLRVYYEELSEDKVPLRATTKMEIKTWD